MKVFIVINEALHHDSSYHDIIGVYSKKEDAVNRIGCEAYDCHRSISNGDFGKDFDEMEIDESNWPFPADKYVEAIVSTKGYYEVWNIEEWEII